MRWLKQSTSVDVPVGPFLDASDGVTAMTGLTITQPDIRLKKNNANWAQKNAAQTLSHEEGGFYEVTLDTTDTGTLGLLRLAINESGALPVWEDFMILPANVWDALFGADALQVHAVEIANGLITASALASDAITDTKIASGAFTAAKFASGALDAVWSVATRLLTAGTNIVLAKGTGVTGFNDLSAVEVNAEVDTALADVNLDHIAGTAASIPAIPAGTYLDQLMDDGTAAYDRTTDSLQAIRDHATTIKSETASILTDTAEIGAAGAGLSAVPWNATWDAQVESEATDALNAYDPPTRAELTSDTNSVLTAVGDVPTNAELATALGTADDAVLAAIAALDTLIDGVKAQTDLLPGSPAATGDAMTLESAERNAIATALLDLANGVESGATVRTALKAMSAIIAGEVTDAGTGVEIFQAFENPGTTRVTVTVDGSGNRSDVTVS
jgi:hypothetical protein